MLTWREKKKTLINGGTIKSRYSWAFMGWRKCDASSDATPAFLLAVRMPTEKSSPQGLDPLKKSLELFCMKVPIEYKMWLLTCKCVRFISIKNIPKTQPVSGCIHLRSGCLNNTLYQCAFVLICTINKAFTLWRSVWRQHPMNYIYSMSIPDKVCAWNSNPCNACIMKISAFLPAVKNFTKLAANVYVDVYWPSYSTTGKKCHVRNQGCPILCRKGRCGWRFSFEPRQSHSWTLKPISNDLNRWNPVWFLSAHPTWPSGEKIWYLNKARTYISVRHT